MGVVRFVGKIIKTIVKSFLVVTGILVLIALFVGEKPPPPEPKLSKPLIQTTPPVEQPARNNQLEVNPLQEFAAALIDEKDAHVKTTLNGDALTVSYSLAPWQLTAEDAFIVHTEDLIPRIFYKFPAINSIAIAADATFVDKRGNESTGPAIIVRWTRANAASINWAHVEGENLFDLADWHWKHP